jgi:HTH-type transcriptional regulator/antitoxin HigA
MRKASLGSEGIGGLIENLPLLLNSVSEQLSSVSYLLSACLEPVENDEDLQSRMAIIDELYAYAEDIEHIAIKFADLISDRVYEYEVKNREIPNVSPDEALAFFMKDRGVRQVDLRDIASQSVVSEIIHKKRSMSVEQVKGFSKFFGVPLETFMGA